MALQQPRRLESGRFSWDRGRLARRSASAQGHRRGRTPTVDDCGQSILRPESDVRASRFSGRDARGPSERGLLWECCESLFVV